MSEANSLSPENQIKAAATLARGGALALILRWTLMVGVPIITALSGWAVAKLDTKSDLADLRLAVDRLTTQQGQLADQISEAIPSLQRRITGVQHDVVVSTGAALAYETEKRSKEKLSAGVELGRSFIGMIQRGEPPEASARSVIKDVAVPHVAR